MFFALVKQFCFFVAPLLCLCCFVYFVAAMVFFKCFKSNTITILAKEGDSQDKGTTLKLCELLDGPKAIVLPAKDKSIYIKSWSSNVSWEVTDFDQPNTKKKTCMSRILILNLSHHARDNSPASFELLGNRVRNGAVTWNSTLPTIGEPSLLSFIESGLKMS